jgi:acyl-CoA synthetase (AMP-forming)/AMP-acid ligase II
MHLGLVLEMVHSGYGSRTAVTVGHTSLDYAALAERSWAATGYIRQLAVPSVVYIGGNDLAYPVSLFGAAGAGVPFIPLNYRLGTEQLTAQVAAHPGSLILHAHHPPFGPDPDRTLACQSFLDQIEGVTAEPPPPVDPELPCILLYTSGTTSAPKAAVLRHRHLMSYLFGTVEFASADEDEAALVSVPPYHIAGVANLLSNLFAGRRIIYLDRFDPEVWLETVRHEQVTQAMVIPTMLARVVTHLDGAGDAGAPSLRSLSYGGARMPVPVLERAVELFPDTGFVNAYGLTETSSTVALLGPDDHRAALASNDPVVRARLGSVGRLLPGIELDVRDESGSPLPVGEAGLLFFRGEQIAGEYAGEHAGHRVVDDDGWFSSRDRGWIDQEGYLFIEGRADDTIIRGGENIAPAEIEDVLLGCEGIVDAAVVGLADDEWGQRLVAVVVPESPAAVTAEQLKERVRHQLRSSKTPESIEFWPELPRTDTGKLLRRQIVARLAAG